ncbi:MAG: hypothetical protein ABIO02_01365, partial [Patescibacteria group bacterium]
KEVGDESKEVNVKAQVSTIYYTYSGNDLKKLMLKSLQPDVEDGYSLPLENIKTTITDAEKSDDSIEVKVKTTGKAIKQISKDELISTVKGKGKNSVSDVLKSKFGAVKVDIEDKALSFFPWMPVFKKNITIEINSL